MEIQTGKLKREVPILAFLLFTALSMGYPPRSSASTWPTVPGCTDINFNQFRCDSIQHTLDQIAQDPPGIYDAGGYCANIGDGLYHVAHWASSDGTTQDSVGRCGWAPVYANTYDFFRMEAVSISPCPNGTSWFAAAGKCLDADPSKNVGIGSSCPAAPRQICLFGNPINVAIGNKYQREVDIELPPLLSFVRHYNSLNSTGSSYHLGPQWSHTFARTIQYLNAGTSGATAVVSRPDGSQVTFRSVSGQWQADADIVGTLIQHNDAQGQLLGWTYTPRDGREVEEYDTLGRLLQVTQSDGSTIALTYNNGAIQNNANDYLLTRVQDQSGRSLTFVYDTSLRISTITDAAGAVYGYGYDAAGNLATVTYPGGVSRTYLYNEPAYTSGANLPTALTGIVHEDGLRYATFAYAADGRAISTEHAGGVEKFVVQYNADGSSVVTTPAGVTQQRTFDTVLGVKKPTSVVETCADCGP